MIAPPSSFSTTGGSKFLCLCNREREEEGDTPLTVLLLADVSVHLPALPCKGLPANMLFASVFLCDAFLRSMVLAVSAWRFPFPNPCLVPLMFPTDLS